MKSLSTCIIVGALLGLSCVTPQIPLPPPDPGILSLGLVDPNNHTVELTGAANDRTRSAWIYIINENQESGIIIQGRTDGSFKTPAFEADDGDQLTIDYRRGVDWSDPTCVVVDYANTSLTPCD